MSLPGMPEVDIPASEGPMPHSAYQDLDPHQMQSQSASLIVAEQQNNLSQEGYSAGTIVIRSRAQSTAQQHALQSHGPRQMLLPDIADQSNPLSNPDLLDDLQGSGAGANSVVTGSKKHPKRARVTRPLVSMADIGNTGMWTCCSTSACSSIL
jgi:hypothetical protein